MSAKVENNPVSVSGATGVDYAILIAAAAIIGAGIFAYYHFNPVWAGWVRVLVFVGSLLVGGAVALVSAPGKNFLKFLDAALLEVRKVVWPTKQETTQTTMVIVVAVFLVGILMFIIDYFLALFVSATMGG
jgi:preprotein translocase subunit SecE